MKKSSTQCTKFGLAVKRGFYSGANRLSEHTMPSYLPVLRIDSVVGVYRSIYFYDLPSLNRCLRSQLGCREC